LKKDDCEEEKSMFLNLGEIYRSHPGGRHAALVLPAAQLARWLDELWFSNSDQYAPFPGSNQFSTDMEDIRRSLAHPQPTPQARHGMAPSGLDPNTIPSSPPLSSAPFALQPGPLNVPGPRPEGEPTPLIFQHLMYSFLIESTGAYDILAEVARRLVAGETLGTLSRESIVWLRNTEELFFRDPPLFSITGVTSDLRPSGSSGRRNAYWRMFGMDLPHQIPSGWPGSQPADAWKARAGSGVNTDFQEKLVELLRQVWVGIVNSQNTIGVKPSDPEYIALLCTAIRDMLHNRRKNGLLAREEFVYVTFMSWFHLTLLGGTGAAGPDAPIVRDLQATGTAPEQRLNNLAQKVEMKPAARSRELFQLSELMSILLRDIELGAYDTAPQAEILFDGTDTPLVRDMRTIINLWQSATGQRIKDAAVAPTSTVATQPIRIPTPAGALASSPLSSNGGVKGR
jgi:hypothetical protein